MYLSLSQEEAIPAPQEVVLKYVIDSLSTQEVFDRLERQELQLADLAKEQMISGDEYPKIIASTELAELGINPGDKNYDELFKILSRVASESRDQYPITDEQLDRLLKAEDSTATVSEDLDEKAAQYKKLREKATADASEPGIEAASKIISLITGKDKVNATDLVARVTIDNLIDLALQSITKVAEMPISKQTFDKNKISAEIRELAPQNWMSPENIKTIEAILTNKAQDKTPLSDVDLKALVIASVSVHTSWSGLQGVKSSVEQKESFDAYFMDREKRIQDAQDAGTAYISDSQLKPSDRLTNTPAYKDLRPFRDSVATLTSMIVSNFISAYRTQTSTDLSDAELKLPQDEQESAKKARIENAHNVALARAIFELMKDLVKIAKP